MGDNHVMIPQNKGDQHRRRQGNVLQGPVGHGRAGGNLRFQKPHLPAGKILHVNGGRGHDEAADFTGRNQLRTQHQVDVEIFLDIVHRLRQELRIPDAGNGMGDSVFLRQYAGNDIHLVHGGHRHQQVASRHIPAPHKGRTGAVGLDGEHVQVIPDGLQLFPVRVHHHHIITFVNQKIGNNIAQMACANDNDTHICSFDRKTV